MDLKPLVIKSGQIQQLQSGDALIDAASAGYVVAASTFGTDNSIIRADGTARAVQSSNATLSDVGEFVIVTSAGIGTSPPVKVTDNSLNVMFELWTGAVSNENLFVGRTNAVSLTTGAGNVAVGVSALRSVTAGGNNAALGLNAGRSVTTGTNNVFVGSGAGFHASQLASAENSIVLGRDAYSTTNNQAVLGSHAVERTLLRGTVDVARTSNPCRLNVYNTASDDPPTTDIEMVSVRWDTNVAKIGTHKSGSGVARNLVLETDGTARLTCGASGRVSLSTIFNIGTASSLTISGGSITASSSFLVVDTEGAASADDLDNITGGVEGDVVVIRSLDASRVVTVRDSVGNIRSNGDRVLDSPRDTLLLVFDGSNWLELSFSNNE